MRALTYLGLAIMLGAGTFTSGCASISEDDCLAGNWAERGFKDGKSGRSGDRLGEYAKRCAEFSAPVDRTAYLREYQRGLGFYCVYDTGFERGKAGSSYNDVCTGALADGFSQGYEEGRVVYRIKQQHNEMIDTYNNVLDDVIEVRRKLREDELVDKERRRLQKKLLRLQDRRETLREDIRDYEYEYNLPRYNFD